MSTGSRPQTMRSWLRSPFVLIFASLSPWLAGCGEGGVSVVPVSGTITLNGQPLEGATVFFTPAADNPTGTPGTDTTGPEGNYKLQYSGRFGVAPGKYKVLVSKEYNSLLAEANGDLAEDDLEMLRVMAEPSPGDPEPRQAGGVSEAKIVEAKETFDREVLTGEENIFEFDLKASAADAKILQDNP